jgi:superfamily I DNA and/or RNA helicase
MLALGKFGTERIVLVGDPQQLRPVLLSSLALDSADASRGRRSSVDVESKGEGLSKTLFTRLSRCGLEPIMLKTQYRCHPVISRIASNLFYDGKLLDGITAEDRAPIAPGLPPVVLCHAEKGREEADRFGSFFNEQEAQTVATLAEILVLGHEVDAQEIGVIALYKAQVSRISAILNAKSIAVQVSTVDAFQGAEKDVIILSVSRTTKLGFSDSPKRLNVAITRARRHLIIVGNAPLLTSNSAWEAVVGPAISTVGGLQSCTKIITSRKLDLVVVAAPQ